MTPRTRRILLSSSAAACIFLFAADVATVRWSVLKSWSNGFGIVLQGGTIGAGFEGPGHAEFTIEPHPAPRLWWFTGYGDLRTSWYAAAPLWLPTLALGVITVLLVRNHRRALRIARNNLCPRCAYSLANLPPNSPCPECGDTP